jgi:hypothetical protein
MWDWLVRSNPSWARSSPNSTSTQTKRRRSARRWTIWSSNAPGGSGAATLIAPINIGIGTK